MNSSCKSWTNSRKISTSAFARGTVRSGSRICNPFCRSLLMPRCLRFLSLCVSLSTQSSLLPIIMMLMTISKTHCLLAIQVNQSFLIYKSNSVSLTPNWPYIHFIVLHQLIVFSANLFFSFHLHFRRRSLPEDIGTWFHHLFERSVEHVWFRDCDYFNLWCLHLTYLTWKWRKPELGLECVANFEVRFYWDLWLSNLPPFRLLRVFRLAQMWGTMRRLLSIIAKSIMDVGYLTIVLFIVLYIFAVIGMSLLSSTYTAVHIKLRQTTLLGKVQEFGAPRRNGHGQTTKVELYRFHLQFPNGEKNRKNLDL